jgi:anaerobic selenocysteine-containing dehydrogenase
MVRLSTRRGSVEVAVEPNPRMRPGHISLPNGLGLTSGETDRVGIAPNELTSSDDRDELSGIPLHKHVLARIDVL